MAMGVLFASHTFSTCQENKSDRKNLKQFHFFKETYL
jgi:hypothetical protein